MRARGLCDGEVADARWANPGLRVYCCCCCSSCPDLGLGFVSVLSRFCLGVVSPHLPQTPYHPTGGLIGIYMIYRSLGEGDPNGKFSEERCMCVRARGLCGERWQMLPGQNRGSKCTAAAAAPARISTVLSRLLSRCCLRCLGFVSVLSRFCLGLVSPLLPQTPYHPTGGVIGI